MRKIIALACAITLIASCAREPKNPLEGMTDIAFRSWISNNAPNAKLVAEDSDIYIEYFERGNGPKVEITGDSWLTVNYTGRLLNGVIFTTRSEAVSKQLNKWTNTTHWVDHFISQSVLKNETFCFGLLFGIERGLQPGDSARIYIPAKYGYGGSEAFNKGYRGEVTYANLPIYFDIRLKEVTEKPEDRELAMVNKYASEKWSLTLDDTISKGLYMRITKAVPDADTIPKEESALLTRNDYFLDRFIINTTSEDTAVLYNILKTDITYRKMPVSMEKEAKNDKYLSMFYKVIKKMKQGEEAEIITISSNTSEKNEGKETGIPQINYYTPRLYKIVLHPLEKKEEKSTAKPTTGKK